MTRFLDSLVDSAGLLLVASLAAGCLSVAGPVGDLRPFVATTGSYTLTAPDAPSPTPAPTVCKTCGGTGRLGDGRVFVPCPDCQKKQEAASCPNQSCTVR